MTVPSSPGYPASFTLDPPERIANWRPLVQWLLALPHYVILYGLEIVSHVAAAVSWFAIVFTGKDIEGLQGVRMMFIRYQLRTQTYAAFLRDEYPPFAFEMVSGDSGADQRVRVDFAPALEGRSRVTTFFRVFMVIPHLAVLAILGIAAILCGLIAFFAVLFTGRWPDGLRTFVVAVMRWSLRVQVYFLLLTDEYPPFRLD